MDIADLHPHLLAFFHRSRGQVVPLTPEDWLHRSGVTRAARMMMAQLKLVECEGRYGSPDRVFTLSREGVALLRELLAAEGLRDAVPPLPPLRDLAADARSTGLRLGWLDMIDLTNPTAGGSQPRSAPAAHPANSPIGGL